jgi:hypothetical protein
MSTPFSRLTPAELQQLQHILIKTLGMPRVGLGVVVMIVQAEREGSDDSTQDMFAMGVTESGVQEILMYALCQTGNKPRARQFPTPTEG